MFQRHFKKSYLLFLTCLFMFFAAAHVHAVDLFFEANTQGIHVGDTFTVTLKLDPEKVFINALEASLITSDNIVPVSIDEQGSFVPLWVERPSIKNKAVTFSGLVPAGYDGDYGAGWRGARPGKVVSVIYKALYPGVSSIQVKNARILLHDGNGSESPISTDPRMFTVETGTSTRESAVAIDDTTPPERFELQVVNDAQLYSGVAVLIFATQDKDSGIDHYEVAEARKHVGEEYDSLAWSLAESPYVLKNQKQTSYIYVKAVDRAGNSRIIVLKPEHGATQYENKTMWIILSVLGLIIIFSATYNFWKKRNHGDN
jgi:hypothetical protein